MSRESEKPPEIEPEALEIVAELRDGLERAHEIVAEHKLALRELGEEPPPVPDVRPIVPDR